MLLHIERSCRLRRQDEEEEEKEEEKEEDGDNEQLYVQIINTGSANELVGRCARGMYV